MVGTRPLAELRKSTFSLKSMLWNASEIGWIKDAKTLRREVMGRVKEGT